MEVNLEELNEKSMKIDLYWRICRTFKVDSFRISDLLFYNFRFYKFTIL